MNCVIVVGRVPQPHELHKICGDYSESFGCRLYPIPSFSQHALTNEQYFRMINRSRPCASLPLNPPGRALSRFAK